MILRDAGSMLFVPVIFLSKGETSMKHVTILLSLIFFTVPVLGQPALAGPSPARVLTEKLMEQEKTQFTPMQGFLYFDTVCNASTEVCGLVNQVYFSNGATVKKGDILVRLNTDFTDQDIRLKQTQIQRLDLRIEHAKKDLERYIKLLDQEAASETDFEHLSYAHKELVKERDALKINLDKVRLKKNKSVIRAPFDGIILEKDVDRGNWIQPGKSLCKIGFTGDLFVNVPVNESLLKFFESGTSIRVVLNAFDREVTGHMEGILPQACEKTKNISLKIRIPAQTAVAENMSATAYIPTSHKKKLKKIPRDAIVRRQGKSFVYTVIDDKAKSLPLEVLFFKGAYAYTDTAGLISGMAVIVDGNQRLMENQSVNILGGHL